MRFFRLYGLGAGLLAFGAVNTVPIFTHPANAAETKKKKKGSSLPVNGRAKSGGTASNSTLPAVIGPASALLFAPQNDPMARLVATPYGKNASLSLKLNAGDFVDVEVAAPNGVASLQVCYTPDNILAAVWGSSEMRCPGPQSIDHGTARYRMEARGKAEIKLRVMRSSGDAGATYTIRTRGRVMGRGAEMLAMFERMRDRHYIRESSNDGLIIRAVQDYRADVPGKSGVLRYRDEGGVTTETRFEVTAEGDLRWTQNDQSGLVQAGNEGALYLIFPEKSAVGYAFGSQGLITRYEYAMVNYLSEKAPKDQGGFQLTSTQILGPTSPALAEALIANGSSALASAKAKRLADWGVLRLMAGHSFAFTTSSGNERVVTFGWETEGRAMTGKFWDANAYGTTPAPLLRISHDGMTGKINGSYTSSDGKAVQRTSFETGPDNTLIERSNITATYALRSSSEVSYSEGPGKNGWSYRLLGEKDLAMYRQRTQQYQQQLAQQQAQKKSGGGGLLGMAIGAAVGGAIASSGGLDANQTLGAVMKGAAVGAGNSQSAGALNTMGDSLLSGSGGAMGGTGLGATGLGATGLGGASLGGSGRAGSYATKPNLATGACPGFTESNYRQRAFEGGGDTQLFTMCGQAFEYYTMYKRAISQGYSEADANRTYAAHEGAALNAQNFAKNWK